MPPSPKKPVQSYLEAYLEGRIELCNELEEAAFSLSPELKELKERLLSLGAEGVQLCGSGSALFYFAERPLFPNSLFVKAISRNQSDWYSAF